MLKISRIEREGKANSPRNTAIVIEINTSVENRIFLNFPRSSSPVAIPKYLFIPMDVSRETIVMIMRLNAERLDTNPTAAGPAIIAVRNQNKYVNMEGITVPMDANQMFLPTLASDMPLKRMSQQFIPRGEHCRLIFSEVSIKEIGPFSIVFRRLRNLDLFRGLVHGRYGIVYRILGVVLLADTYQVASVNQLTQKVIH